MKAGLQLMIFPIFLSGWMINNALLVASLAQLLRLQNWAMLAE